MPFANYLMWVSPLSAPGGGPFAAARLDAERQEIHDLAKHLLRVYNGTGKSFYLGNWEGDWLLTHTDPNYAPTTEEVQSMINWANTRQQAVDDAWRDTPHANVHIYYYVELNRVRDAMNGKVRVANKVLPRTNPDFVSYSSYDAQNGDIEKNFAEALKYIQAQHAPKPRISGKRVFIGEYGMPLLGNSAQAQDILARHVMRAGLKWGCPFVLYWEMYNNEVTADGRQRGFWLIDDHGIKQPVYFTHQKFYEKARAYVADFTVTNRRVPSREEFGLAALAWLPVETASPVNGPLAQGAPFVDGLRDFSTVFRHSDHLILDGTNPGLFEGRALRLRRDGADTPRHFVYHGNGIARFKITTYVIGGFAGTDGPKVRGSRFRFGGRAAVARGGRRTGNHRHQRRLGAYGADANQRSDRPGGVPEDRTARRCRRIFAAGGRGAVVHGGLARGAVVAGAAVGAFVWSGLSARQTASR